MNFPAGQGGRIQNSSPPSLHLEITWRFLQVSGSTPKDWDAVDLGCALNIKKLSK